MNRLFFLLLFMFSLTITAQESDTETKELTTKEIMQTQRYKEWKSKFVSEVAKAKSFVNSAKKIQNKYAYKNMWGERVFHIDDFSSIDNKNYLKIMTELGNTLSNISNLNWEYGYKYENVYYSEMELKNIDKSAELFSISQFYSSAW